MMTASYHLPHIALAPPADFSNALVAPPGSESSRLLLPSLYPPYLVLALASPAHPDFAIQTPRSPPSSYAFTRDGCTLATASSRLVTISTSSLATLDYAPTTKLHVRYDVKAMALTRTPSGRLLLATASVRGALVQFVDSCDDVLPLAQSFSICKLDFSPCGAHLVLCASEGQVGVWAVADLFASPQRRVACARVHLQAQITGLALSDSQVALTTFSAEKGCAWCLFSLSDLAPRALPPLPKSKTPGFACFSRGGTLLALASHTSVHVLLATREPAPLLVVTHALPSPVCGLASAGTRLVSRLDRGLVVRDWPALPSMLPKRLALDVEARRGRISSPRFAHLVALRDAVQCWGRLLVGLTRAQTVFVLDAESGRVLARPQVRAACVLALDEGKGCLLWGAAGGCWVMLGPQAPPTPLPGLDPGPPSSVCSARLGETRLELSLVDGTTVSREILLGGGD